MKEQLDSFLAQTRLPDELIITDDCSTDRTLDIISEFKSRAPFDVFIYVNTTRLGFVQNFSKAISLCSGDLIFISDQDDVWMPSKIECISKIACKRNDMWLFINDARLTFHTISDNSITMIKERLNAGLSLNRYLTNGCQTAIRRELALILSPIPDFVQAHDIWFHDFARYLGVKLVVPQVLQYWRRHDAGASGFLASKPILRDRIKNFLAYLFGNNDCTARILDEKISYFNYMLKLLDSHGNIFEYSQISHARKCISIDISMCYVRLRSLKKPFIGKAFAIVFNYLNGVYFSVGGLKTAVRDLFSYSPSENDFSD